MSGSELVIFAREDKFTVGVVQLNIPLVLLLIEGHLGTDGRTLGHIRLLGSLDLGELENGEETVLENIKGQLLAPPQLGVLNRLYKNGLLKYGIRNTGVSNA